MNLEPENIFYGVLAFSWIEFFWGSYLSHRQRKIYKKHVEVPDEVKGLLDEETFTKARLYALDKSNFGAFQGIFSQVLSTVFMVYFAFKFLWDVSGEIYSQDLYVHQAYFLIHTLCFISNVYTVLTMYFVIRYLRKNQNMRLVCQNLTGRTYLQLFWPQCFLIT